VSAFRDFGREADRITVQRARGKIAMMQSGASNDGTSGGMRPGQASGDGGGRSAVGDVGRGQADSSGSGEDDYDDEAAAEAFRLRPSERAAALDASLAAMDKEQRLADLFRPPTEIMHGGTFADAKATAKVDRKWLLVNIQSEKEFASHRLNRDTWSNETLQMVLASLCVFWQQYDVSAAGAQFVKR